MEFKEYRLFELSKDNKGYYGIGASAVEYDKNLYTYLRITDIKDDGSLNYSNLKSVNDENANKFILENGDIVFARTGNSTGKSYYYDGEILNLVYAGFLIKFSLNDKKVNPKFIKYYTMTNEYKNWVKEIQTGSTRGNINEKMYGNMRIKLPPRYYQDEVVSLLDKIDKKIKINNQINDNLQAIITNIFNDIIENNDEFQTLQLSDVAKEIVIGKTPSTSKSEYWNGEIPFVTIPDMHNEVYSYKVERCLSDAGSNSQIKKLLPSNSIMVSCIATVGLVSINPVPCHTNQQINSIITKNDYDLFYLYEMLKTKKEDLKNIGASGSATLNVNKNQFEKINIDYPKKEILIDFDKKVRPLFKRIMLIQQENIKLEQIRDTLLSKLMNGEIDLDKIEI